MTQRYVYLIADYDEHGSENMCATLDRSRLPAMLRRNWAHTTGLWLEEAAAGLAKALEQPDEKWIGRDGRSLTGGWGGPQLFVVRLDEDLP